MTTIRDVARLAGVTPSTASLALNSRKRVSSKPARRSYKPPKHWVIYLIV